MDWELQQLRISLLLSQSLSSVQTTAEAVWREMFRADAEVVHRQGQGAAVVCSGLSPHSFKGEARTLSATLRAEAARVDLFLQAPPTNTPGGEMDCGDPSAVLGDAAHLVTTAVATRADVARVAIAPTLFSPAESYERAVTAMLDRLPGISIQGEVPADFVLQMNRRIDETESLGYWVNRVTKWHVVNRRLFSMQIGPDGQQLGSSTPGRWYSALDLDINNAPADDGAALSDVGRVMGRLSEVARGLIEEVSAA